MRLCNRPRLNNESKVSPWARQDRKCWRESWAKHSMDMTSLQSTPRDFQEKYFRCVELHQASWDEICFDKFYHRVVLTSEASIDETDSLEKPALDLLSQMEYNLPIMPCTIVCDLGDQRNFEKDGAKASKQDVFCQVERECDNRAICGYNRLMALYVLATVKFNRYDFVSSIRDAIQALGHFPPIRQDEAPSFLEVAFLVLLGRIQYSLGDLEHAYETLRAACACHRLFVAALSESKSFLLNFISEHIFIAVKESLEILTKIKLDEGVRRPHYLPEERMEVQRDLSLLAYSFENYKNGCSVCGTCTKDGAQIYACSGCSNVLFCCKTCEFKQWTQNGHWKECRKLSSTLRLSSRDKATIYSYMDSVNEDGFLVIIGENTSQASVICKDPDTGLYFESITNANVEFQLKG